MSELTDGYDQLSELGRTAVSYAQLGWEVFPCGVREKRPHQAAKKGCNDGTTDLKSIVNFWTFEPNANIAIVCGQPSGGLLVIDLDVDEDKGKDGVKVLKEWERINGELPETAEAETGSGGKHLYYYTDRTTIRPSVNPDLGVDVRCNGSYVIAPGSVHPSGRLYEWIASPWEVEIAIADGAVYDFLDYIHRNGGEDPDTKKPNGKFKLPDKIKEGRRDETLFKYASHLRAIGRSDEEIKGLVTYANMEHCRPPMSERDIARIVKSACRYEQGSANKADDGRALGRPGGASSGGSGNGVSIAVPRGPRGSILTNELAKIIMQLNHACTIDSAPAVWRGKRWEFGVSAINNAVLDLADDAKKQDKAEVVSYLMDRMEDRSSDTEFDGKYYVQFKNCTYCVTSDEVVTPDPSMFIFAELPVNLNFDAPRNAADDFLDSISDGDENVRSALCEIIGACICSKRALSQSPMLIGRAGGMRGKASNGKSTYLNWLRVILGNKNVSSLDIVTLGQRFQAGRVMGKLANLGDDIPDGFLRGNELSTFKKLVTGDKIYTDIKNAEGFEFRPAASMVFSMNAIPRLSDTTEGVFRRLAFIPFRKRFTPGEPDYDPDILKKLTQPEVLERGALLGLMALGDLIDRGTLTAIPDMAAEVEEVKQDNNSVLRWMFDCDIAAEDLDRQGIENVYKEYRDWCDEAGERSPFTRQSWTRKVLEGVTFRDASKSKRLKSKSSRVAGSSKFVRIFTICDE